MRPACRVLELCVLVGVACIGGVAPFWDLFYGPLGDRRGYHPLTVVSASAGSAIFRR